MAAVDNKPPSSPEKQGEPKLNGTSGISLGGTKSMPGTRRHSGDAGSANNPNNPNAVNGAAAAAPGTAAAAGLPPVTNQPRGEDSLSATLERLRLNAQAAKNGAAQQSGGQQSQGGQGGQQGGIIGNRDGRRGPPPNSRLSKSSLPSSSGNPSLSSPNGLAQAQAQAAAQLARVSSNAGSNAGGETQMGSFVFDDELDAELHNSTYGGRYLQMNADDDKFPVLIRRDSYPGILSAASAALDLAPLSQTPPRNAFMRGEPGARQTSEWPQFSENGAPAPATGGANTPTASGAGAGSRVASDSSKVTGSPRTGRGLPPPRSATKGEAGTPTSATSATPASAAAANASSTASSTGAAGSTNVTASGTAPSSERTSPSLGDITGSPNKQHSATLNGSGGASSAAAQAVAVANLVSPPSPEEIKRKAQLQRERERLERASAKFSDGTPSPAAMYAGELAALNGTFSPYPVDSRNGGGGGGNGGNGNGYYGDSGNYYNGGRGGPGGPGGRGGMNGGGPGSQNGGVGVGGPGGPQGQQQRREEPNRFAGLRLEDLQGDMASLCKDQHGCRFLQKKLEEGNPEHRDMIFNEIYPTFGELMTDSFGNYLSQKLLEHSTDEQRDALLESISGELVSISLNMHGTRAVQKMIDYLSTQRQVQSLIMALNLNVVTLIKDLNGNHVIQKCLNTLPPEDNQFIYNAVAANCIEVATHRHGCCVLQRCIDHASESQRIQLVTEITYNSLTLVLDPFGNYVVQYVLDLNDSRFISAIVNQFRNNVCALSAQKFSSNVVEKCIRVADLEGRKTLITELIDRSRLERMLRDSFANYVVQTALDYAEPGQRAELVAIIRPVLPMIRNTPYGKRIQSKIQREGFHDGYGRGGYGHPGMYGGGMGMGPGPGMGYYGMPHYGPPQHHGGPPQHHGGPPQHHHGGPPQQMNHPGHHGGPPGPYGAGPPSEYMGRGTPGPYGHHQGYPQHMQAHMASPAMSHPYSPSFGPTGAAPGMEYGQTPNYPYL